MFVIIIALTMILSTGSFLTLSPVATGTAPGETVNEVPDPMIRLRYANFDPFMSEPSIPSMLKAPLFPPGVKAPCIVQSKGKVTEEWKAELEKTGAEIVGYIPDNALLVRMNQASREGVNQLSSVNWCGNYEPAYKISPDLNGLSGLITIDISFFIKGTNGPTVRFLRDNGAEFLDIANNEKVNKLIVRADASLINEITSHPDVKWISQHNQQVKCNNPSTQLHQSGSTVGGRVIADDPTDPIPGRQINGDLKNDGAGFGDGDRKVVAVSDSGIRTTHEVWSEAGKVIDNYVPDGSDGELGVEPGDSGEHGQATASMICGDAPGYVDYTIQGDGKDGAAFGARMIFQDIGKNFADPYVYPPPDYYHDLFEDAQHGDVANGHIGGASVHSNCWGGASGYSDESAQIDEYVWDNKDYVICWVVGADGPSGSTISDQAEAKNCIGVGATTEAGTAVTSFSSRGPTVPDGRIKPDLVAVGEGITTANNAGDTSYWPDNWSGTSAATSGLAGHVALVQQYFEDGWAPTGVQTNDNGFTPSAALVKAAMINGAVDLETADVPNMVEGWGRIHLENSLYFQGDSRVVRYIDYGMNMPGTTKGAGLCTDDSIEYKFNVTGAASPFRVSLVWSDYKGDPAASIMLVNDLDLSVEAPGGSTYKGNVFSGGDSQTGGSYDVLNNIECAYLSSPAVGEYTITINASNIPIGPQDFALVVSGDMDPGYGIISMDRVEYTVQDTINLMVNDPNNLAGTVQVTLTSSGSGDSETFDLTATGASTGTFVGNINTEFNVVIVDDGILQINNGDTVTATYSDSNPIHDSAATASIQTFGPVITNVRVEDIMGTTAMVKWDTDIPSNSTVYFGTSSDSGLWTDAQGNEDYTTTHVLPLIGLTTETLYYFDVASSTTRGATSRDDFGGSHYTFSTTGLASGPMVFFVDDDDGSLASDGTPFNEDWENSLNAFGWTYTRWDIVTMGTPTQADMEQAKVVMWVVSDGYPQISAADRDALDDYLEFSPDPKLFVVGQDIGWDMNAGGTDPDVAWYEKHLHAIFERDDADGGGGDGSITIYGIPGDPISGDYTGGIGLNQGVYGAGRFWPDDISNNGGTICWDYSVHAGGGDAAGIRADETQTNAHTGYPGYRMVYEAWAHEMMGTWNPPIVDPIRSDVLDKSLIWLLGADHPEVTLTYPTGGETLSGTETITWSSVGSVNTKVFYSP
ncbi:MAG: S8 family serine peptidase, partial [Thermoplasmata archaeon]|nr:S8 family serine peptidase [Thermoplasmata archaeon]